MLLLLALLLAPARARAASHVTAELIADQADFAPGTPLTVGIKLTMRDGWRTYWRNPGDSGMPTSVQWRLPDGVAAGALQWPIPKRFLGKRSVTYGYDDQAVLLADLTAAPPVLGRSGTIAAKVSWLECKEICVPGQAELTLARPAAPDPQALAQARARVPRERGLEVRAIRSKKGLELRFAKPRDKDYKINAGQFPSRQSPGFAPAFFPSDNEAVGNDRSQDVRDLGGAIALSLSRSRSPEAGEAAALDGLLVLAPDRAMQISVPIRDK